MSNSPAGLTATDLIANASKILLDSGYRQIERRFPEFDTPTSRLFEDEYSVVGVTVFDTCDDLLRSWADNQGKLVDVISRHVGKAESKSWDGYLLLLTPSLAPSESTTIDDIRYNTSRLRKLVATGEDLKILSDVSRVLQPLLPLQTAGADTDDESALDILPRLLRDQQISEDISRSIIEAFKEQAPILERLHKRLGNE